MTESLAPSNPYTSSFSADVTEIKGRDIMLDQTYFYPEGGGQPADRGTVAGLTIETVQKRGNRIIHTLENEPAFEEGDTVQAEIDSAFRRYCMRTHTASHVLYGAGRRIFDELGYGGFGIDEEKARIDFQTTTHVTDDSLVELERLVNRIVWESRSVMWTTYPADEARALDGIAFNTKTEEGIMMASETIRVVEIEDWDLAACGGTHVENTSEIGPVTVLDRSNPGEGLVRIEIAVGPPGIAKRSTEKQALYEAANTLGTAPERLSEEIVTLQEKSKQLGTELATVTNQLAENQLDSLRGDIRERDGVRWLVGFLAGLDSNTIGEKAKALVGDAADVVVLVGGDNRTYLAAASDSDAVAATHLVESVTDRFGGGGGGSESYAQAGGIEAEPPTVIAFLEPAE